MKLAVTGSKKKVRAALCAAIGAQRVIEFYYHGGYRTVEPFCLGVVLPGAADNESLLCYQVGGFSELLEPVGWKLYRASEMSEIAITGNCFSGSRPGYDPACLEMAEIYCCVTAASPGGGRPALELVRGAPAPEAPADLTHNELMHRFRFAHPLPLPELETVFFAGPPPEGPPERPESKSAPVRAQDKHFLVPGARWPALRARAFS